MKNIITAIKNPILYNNLKKEKNLKILYKDIKNSNELIEKIKNIEKLNYVILSQKVIEKNKIINYLKKINIINKKINIILILENKENIDIEVISNFKNCKIFYTEENTYIDIKNYINDFENKRNIFKNKKINSNKKLIFFFNIKNSDKKILSKNLEKIINKKILIINSNKLNTNNQKKLKSKNFSKIIKLKNEIYITNDVNQLFNKYKIIKDNYDYIIIFNTFNNPYFKKILNVSENIIYFLESKKTNIKKLNDFIYKNKIEKEKINLIISNSKINSISNLLIKKYFNNIKIIGSIKSKYYFNKIENLKYKIIIKKLIK